MKNSLWPAFGTFLIISSTTKNFAIGLLVGLITFFIDSSVKKFIPIYLAAKGKDRASAVYRAYWFSFLKIKWEFKDYPLKITYQPKNKLYWASFFNWNLNAWGDSEASATSALKEVFEKFRKENKLPRPGTIVPTKFASDQAILDMESKYPGIMEDLFGHILGYERSSCFISDESSLHDFHDANGITTAQHLLKIKERYGIELSGSDDLGFVNLVKLIAETSQEKLWK